MQILLTHEKNVLTDNFNCDECLPDHHILWNCYDNPSEYKIAKIDKITFETSDITTISAETLQEALEEYLANK